MARHADVDAEVHSHVGDIVQRGRGGGRRNGIVRRVVVGNLQRHQAHVPVDARDADAVVAHRADRSGHVRPVAAIVHRVVVVVVEVPAVDVVDVAVAVVVDVVAGNLARVDPDVVGQIGMRVVDARVDNAHHDVRRPGRHVPGVHGADVGAGHAAALAGVVEAPQVAEIRIVGRVFDLEREVRLEVRKAGEHRNVLDDVAVVHRQRRVDAKQARGAQVRVDRDFAGHAQRL